MGLALSFWSIVFSLMVWLLPLSFQWFTLIALNILMAHVYGIQYAYIGKAYPIDKFGMLMALSCLSQCLVNPVSLLWGSHDRGMGAFVFVLAVGPVCVLWALEQARLRSEGIEFVDKDVLLDTWDETPLQDGGYAVANASDSSSED